MIRKEDFFTPKNEVVGITQEDYANASYIVKAIDGVACASYNSYYVIDYYKHDFLYVSNNPLFLCGCEPEYVCGLGHEFYLKHVPESEHKLLLTVNHVGFDFFEDIPIAERMDYIISYEFHLQTESNLILVNHKLKPVLLDKNGHVWLAVCVVSLSSHKDAGHITMRRIGSPEEWEYSLAECQWKKLSPIKLSATEKSILRLSAQGYTMEQIVETIGISINTVKFHKRRLFKKLQVESITEALTYAINSKLI